MPKTFYTDRDIEDLVKQGVQSLIVDDDVVLTDLAHDKARRLGLELLRKDDKPPAAPVRPYIAKPVTTPSVSTPKPVIAATTPIKASNNIAQGRDAVHKRVYDAVVARLGDEVDPKLLDTIIQRVLKSITTS